MKPRAIITTKWDGRNYRPFTVNAIEGYNLDTALDTDSDAWSVSVGDPDAALSRLFERDNEVRVQLFGVTDAIHYLVTGVADEIRREEGTVTIQGRDFSSLATDSIHLPARLKHVRADQLIPTEARQLGMRGPFNFRHTGIIKKTYATDGSETYWEFWYRLIRKEQLWIWCSPDGALNMGKLNYDGKPAYYIGDPPKGTPAAIAAKYLPVVGSPEFNKTTQSRVESAYVFFHQRNWGNLTIARDASMKDWIKKPNRVLLDQDARTGGEASKLGAEEIFEGKVGSIEFSVVIPHNGVPIRTNEIANVNLPSEGISGEYFVVGNQVMGDSSGFVQRVRLREKIYALTRRVPEDPKLGGGDPDPQETLTNAAGVLLNVRWATYFIAAARRWHGPWDFTLFLATLIAICDQETSFMNYRSFGGPGGDRVEWYDWYSQNSQQDAGRHREQPERRLVDWQRLFANEPGEFTGATWAVGPMQLYTLTYKHWADDLYKPNFHDQYRGGRWHPQWNIMAAAHALRTKLQEMVNDIGQDRYIWAGVSAYGHHYAGETALTVPTRYAVEVRNKVERDPGYLEIVKQAFVTAREEAKNAPTPPFGVPPSATTGSAADAAKRILQAAGGKYHDDNGRQISQWRKVARNERLNNQCGYSVALAAKVPLLITYLMDRGYSVGTYAICEDHSCNDGDHPKGRALDISSLGRPGVGHFNLGVYSSIATSLTKEVMRLAHSFGAYEIICNGVGRYDGTVQALQWDSGRSRGGVWADDHTNHIHVGFRG